ncbi:MAG: YihY/virulence factor BrkB family protein, partial [Bacillota bacterium]|nr:YihY/virulence factor BrkB family protein [Bacillota bacterium]
RWPLGFFLYLFIMGYIYYILPTEKRPFRVVMPGACFASAGILVVSWGYSYYTGTLVNYDITYGALSTVVAMMMWFLLLSWVILLGIMINKVLIDTKKPFSKMEPPEHLEISERQHANKSKFDINPDDVNLRTIGDILMNNDKVQHVENPIKKIKRK